MSSIFVLKEKVNELYKTQTDELLVYLPDDLYVAVGQSMELYNNEVIWTGNIENYHVLWNCKLGKNLEGKFSVTALEEHIGTYPLELTIYDNNMNQVYSEQVNLHIVTDCIPQQIEILNIGDSLSSDKAWYEFVRELSSQKISFVGTRGIGECMHEGRPGFSAMNYLTDIGYTAAGEVTHSFYNKEAGRFDYGYYKEKYHIQPDIVQIWLGVNNMKLDPTENVEAIKGIIDYIREDDEDIPIYIVNTPYLSNQDGIGYQQDNDGYAVLPGTWKLEEDRKIMNLMLALEERLSHDDSIYFVPVAIMHDSENNYLTKELPVNPESSIMESIVVESVHPNEVGYKQIASCMYSVYCGTVSSKKQYSENN